MLGNQNLRICIFGSSFKAFYVTLRLFSCRYNIKRLKSICDQGDDALMGLGSFVRVGHLCALIHIRIKGDVVTLVCLGPLAVPGRCFFCGSFLLFIFHVCLYYTALSVPCSLVILCWERDDLFSLLRVMFPCVLSLSHMVSQSGVVLDYIDS